MVEVDVGEHGDLGRQGCDGPVRLVSFDDEPAAPALAFAPSCGTSAPMSHAGSSPRRSRQKAIIAAVVVFPCTPATTIARCSDTSSARKSARERPDTRSAYAVETTTSQPSGGSGGWGETATGMPAARTGVRYGVSTRSQPDTSARQACASST